MPFRERFGKAKRKTACSKVYNLSNKINELKQIEGIFSKNMSNHLIINKFK